MLGGLVAAIMAIGAVFGALNTMYSAIAERGREIATMRAVGYSSWNVILSFLFEALLISFIGGILGCLAVLPLNGLTTNTMNFQTFANVAFAFKITFDLLLLGVVFALVMGITRSPHEPRHGPLRDRDAQLAQFTVDSGRSPERIRRGHRADEGSHRDIRVGAPWT